MNERLRQRLLQVFYAEHADHLQVIRQFLDQAAQAPFRPEQLNEAFRRAHSLKGAARAVELPVLEQGAHLLETLFVKVQAGELPLPPLFKLLHQWLDFSEDWLSAQLQQTPLPDPTAALVALEKALLPTGTEEAMPVPLQTEPSLQSEGVQSDNEPVVVQNRADSGLDEYVRISSQHLEILLDSSDRLMAESLQQNVITGNLRDMLLKISELEKHWHQCQVHVPVSAQREAFVSVLRELTVLSQENRHQQQQSTWKLSQEVHYLQSNIREIRMQPARSIFQSFPKMLRRLAQEQGKEIQCQFTGLDIEADRVILQLIKDPVMHLLRNALAHGIEGPEERRQKGKNPVGKIACHLEVRRHQLIIQISDDGQGLNQTQIRSRLAEKSPQMLELDNWKEAIFQPGFSTAQGVNELSGRGMGLSVVAESISRLQGKYRLLDQTPGLCFELEVPLQIVTYRLLVFACEGQALALPAYAVRQLLRIQRTDLVSVDGQMTLIWEEMPVPLYSLSQMLFPGATGGFSERSFSVIVLETDSQTIALQVDSLLAEQESLLRPLTGPASQLPLYLGAALSSQGYPVPVLNPHFLGQLTQKSQASGSLLWRENEKTQMGRILVVDDSITTRTLEKTILESQGYQVAVAVNGREALKKMRETPFDLVITDVQMPEMDGLELLAQIKQETQWSALPVIVLTSLNAHEDQKKGLDLGAAAYLVKQKFEQQELLEMIAQLL